MQAPAAVRQASEASLGVKGFKVLLRTIDGQLVYGKFSITPYLEYFASWLGDVNQQWRLAGQVI